MTRHAHWRGHASPVMVVAEGNRQQVTTRFDLALEVVHFCWGDDSKLKPADNAAQLSNGIHPFPLLMWPCEISSHPTSSSLPAW